MWNKHPRAGEKGTAIDSGRAPGAFLITVAVAHVVLGALNAMQFCLSLVLVCAVAPPSGSYQAGPTGAAMLYGDQCTFAYLVLVLLLNGALACGVLTGHAALRPLRKSVLLPYLVVATGCLL